MKNIVLLGCGFVGKFLIPVLESNGYKVFPTSRNPQSNLQGLSNSIKFDLMDESTYINIPADSQIIFMFPAEPVEKLKIFYEYIKNTSTVKIVLGTTSSYKDTSGILNEKYPLSDQIKRVQGETFLIKNGAVVLQLSGIYGGSRHPFKWLNKGLIKNSNKTVNLVHVNDICKIILKFLESDLSSERFNLSDGQKYWWKDIWQLAKDRQEVFDECPPALIKEERHISNKKLLSFIGENYSFEKL